MHWLIVAGVGGVLLAGGGSRAAFGNEAGSANRDATSTLLEASAPIIDEVLFVGLRHLAQGAVQAQISSRAGTKLELKRVEWDVHALGRLGWFGEIEVKRNPRSFRRRLASMPRSACDSSSISKNCPISRKLNTQDRVCCRQHG